MLYGSKLLASAIVKLKVSINTIHYHIDQVVAKKTT
jgi:hypothetical protein